MTEEFTFKGDVERLVMGPNDILAFTVPAHTPAQFEEFSQIIKGVAEKMGLKDRYLVLSSDVTIKVVQPNGA